MAVGAALVLALPAHLLLAQDRSQTVVLDVQNKTISPGDPTINLTSQPSVVIDVRSADAECKVTLTPAFYNPPPSTLAVKAVKEASQLVSFRASPLRGSAAHVDDLDADGKAKKRHDSAIDEIVPH